MNRREIGQNYEELAVAYIKAEGYSIIERNFHCKIGEIDIVAQKDGYVRFIEVKYRKDNYRGRPEEAVDIRKQRKICKTASYYLLSGHYHEKTPVCFDVVAILGDEIRLYENAFEYIVT